MTIENDQNFCEVARKLSVLYDLVYFITRVPDVSEISKTVQGVIF